MSNLMEISSPVVWVELKQGNFLPSNAVKSETTQVDGELYVVRVNDVPGKVNLPVG